MGYTAVRSHTRRMRSPMNPSHHQAGPVEDLWRGVVGVSGPVGRLLNQYSMYVAHEGEQFLHRVLRRVSRWLGGRLGGLLLAKEPLIRLVI